MPMNIRPIETNFIGNVLRSIGSFRRFRYFVLRMPLIIRTKNGRVDKRVVASDTGPSANDLNIAIIAIGASTASADISIYSGK